MRNDLVRREALLRNGLDRIARGEDRRLGAFIWARPAFWNRLAGGERWFDPRGAASKPVRKARSAAERG